MPGQDAERQRLLDRIDGRSSEAVPVYGTPPLNLHAKVNTLGEPTKLAGRVEIGFNAEITADGEVLLYAGETGRAKETGTGSPTTCRFLHVLRLTSLRVDVPRAAGSASSGRMFDNPRHLGKSG